MFSRISVMSVAAFCALSSPALADWSATAISQGQTGPGAVGQVFCQAGGVGGAIWGTGTYTSDSSICAAAQHYGWIPPGAGGTVSYRTVPGQGAYDASTQNGLTSYSYGEWGLGFQITDFVANTGAPQPPRGRSIGWSDTPDSLGIGASSGSIYTYYCPASTAPSRTIWGTDPYTSDSPVCVAAQHRGLITSAGGNVTVMVLGPQQGYGAATRNGVTSSDYPAWPRSYTLR